MSPNHPPSLYPEGLSILNLKPSRLPGPCLLHELVSLTSRDGASSAVEFLSPNGHRTTLSYQELHAASTALASHIYSILVSASVLSISKPRDSIIIPILCSQSPQLYVAILAVLKVGGAFCPLNADAPPDRLSFILQDVKAKVVLANQSLVSKLPRDDQTCKIIPIDHVLEPSNLINYGFASPVLAEPEDPAYVMYTSGSTGTPKGVLISHLAASQSILAHGRHIPHFSRFLQFAAPTFDVSVFEMFFPLFRGATLVGCHRAEMLTDLPGVLRAMDVDACELTPSVAGSLLKQRSRAPNLRLLLTIGEMLTEPVIKEFGGHEHKPSMLWGMYGPTEATIHCILQPAFSSTSGRRIIGKPLETVSAFIIRIADDDSVTAQFEVLPVGEVGELAVGGFQLATGYLNRPQQTAASFISTQWGRVYRTGDKALFRSDGTIECLGRIGDSQVKLNGQRLELGEVENALLRTPGCHSAFATIISNVLVAFAAVEHVSKYNSALWDQCRSWLPTFMVPTDIVTMSGLPQLPSGKIDRKQLIQDYMARTTSTTGGSEEALDDQERLLCEVATTILGYKIDPSTEFSPARLDSLAAIVYASTLREKGTNVGVLDILSVRTPRELRKRIQLSGKSSTALESHQQLLSRLPSNHPDLDMSELKGTLGEQVHQIERLELSTPLQQSMIAETLKDVDSYINHIELELPSNAPLDLLYSSLRILAESNEILRTGFVFVGNQLRQVIWKQLDDLQIRGHSDTDGHVDWIENIERFLLRPLRMELRHSASNTAACTLDLTLHHAIYDGWTIDLVIEDLSLLLHGKLPTKRPQFSQISRYVHNIPEAMYLDSMEFWTDHLHGVGAAFLPNLSTVVASEERRCVKLTKIPLKPQTLAEFTLEASVGPQVLFQACLAWLWAAVHGSDDIVIGSVSSGRSLPLAGIDKIMGPCMTTLPLRINVSRHRTILELLQSIHLTNRKTLRHGHLPLSQINKAAGLSTNSKLFDIIFAYQESPASRKQGPNAVRELWHRDATEAKLAVEIQPCEDHFVCQTTFRTEFLPETIIETFTSHLSDLIEHFTNHTDASIANIHHCFPSRGLSHYNDNPTSVETARSLSETVESSASLYSSDAALSFATSISSNGITLETLTYGELNVKANRIARWLQQCGVVSGEVIAIIMEKSPLLYCSILAILKTGCAYLPILPSTPGERVKVILEQAEPCVCLVDATPSLLKLRKLPMEVINIEEEDFSSYSDANLGMSGEPSNLAYVIYTSGTTGTPKGVAVTNKNILSNISVLSRIYPHKVSDKMLQACSQAFDVSIFEIFFAWANGMCLCAATNDILFGDFERSVRAFEITHLSVTVTVASLLNPDNVPGVNFLVTSGEPMTDEVLNKWAQHLYQGYGPSETTNICTVRKVCKGDSPRFLGRSFNNTSTFVLYPKSLDLVPLACVGELCFGGDQVAAGYLKLREATAKSFIDHPTYGRLYRSGDLGRMLPDGSLIIHGRIDTQVKLRGLRIDIREIESTALATGIARLFRIVLVAPESTKSQQLALFYVSCDHESNNFALLCLNNEIKGQITSLQHGLETYLPTYMVPAFIFPVSSLPMTSSSKVDERTLRDSVRQLSIDDLSAYSSATYLGDAHSDWSDTETLIANVITEILKKDRSAINRWTTFSALGIDSISAMPVARKLRQHLRKQVNLSLLLQNPSISRLACAIDAIEGIQEPEVQEGSLLPVELVEVIQKRFEAQGKPVAKVLPCTPLQEAMVMASYSLQSTTTEDGMAYYNQMVLHLCGPYEAMIRHWNDVIQRHEILRACFVTTNNIHYPTVQVILDNHVPQWEILETGDTSIRERASQHLLSVPALADRLGPPISLAIIRTQESGDYLSFVCHHAMYDGIAMQIILSEVESLCQGAKLPHPPPLGPFLYEIESSPPGRDEFWKQLFLGFEPNPLGHAHLTKDSLPRSISSRASTIPLSQIEARLRDLGVSMLATCQAAWAVTLSMFTQTRDVSFGNVVAGRSVSLNTIDDLVAPCFNTLPMRLDLSGSTFMIDAVKNFQAQNAKMIQYQFTSLRDIQQLVNAGGRLFDTLLILQPRPLALDERFWSLVYEEGPMDIPIVCELIPDQLSNTLALQLHREQSKISHQALQIVGNIFSYVFGMALTFPSSHILTIEILPSEWQQDIQGLSPRSDDSDASNRYHDLVITEEGSWTELELVVRKILSQLVERPEEQIERLTPIYHYGLDSISAIQLATLLRRESVNVSAIDVIQNPTCAGIAAATKGVIKEELLSAYDFGSFQTQVEGDIHDSKIDMKNIEAVLPCTATQQGLLFRFQESNGRYYLNFSSWSLGGGVEPDDILRAWSQLATHHQILRTGFIPVNHPDSTFAMLVYKTEHFNARASVHDATNFDLEQWRSNATKDAIRSLAQPPWRVAVVTSEGDLNPVLIHLTIHHALYDAFTLRQLLTNVDDMIRHARQPKVTKLEHVLSHYFHLSRSSEPAGDAYWRRRAGDFVAHKFPVMTPHHVKESRVSRFSRTCSAPSSTLRQAAAKLGVTLQAALQATLTRILGSYLGESRVTFGVVFDGRATSLAQEATFPMITTVPVIADNVPSNVELVQQMMQYNADVRPFQFMPLTRVQRCLGTTATPFDTILIYQPANSGLNQSSLRLVSDIGSVEYPISLEVEELPLDITQLNLTFDVSILPLEQAACFLNQFEAILADFLFPTEQTVPHLSLNRHDLVSALSPKRPELPVDTDLLHELVEHSAQLIPSSIALEFVEKISEIHEARKWTYRELDELGNQAAHFIIGQGVKVGSIVATCFEKCPIAYFTLLGILKAGCTFLCLDPSAPSTRQRFILDDSKASLLLLGDHYDWADQAPLPVYRIDETMLASLPVQHPFLQRPVLPSDSCYCLYTSGTTGTPKGCLMTHENAVQAMAAFKYLFTGRWDPDSRWLQFAAFHFDVSVLEQYWSWYVGITVVTAPKDAILSDITMTISTLAITHIDLTPSLARLTSPDECPTLCRGVFITGGEKLRSDILDTWGSKRVIHNAYGPTEATIGVTMNCGMPENGRPSNIGNLFPNVGAYVFERGTETPVLRGGVGELCLTGKLVGKGYLNRDDLTRERFPVLKSTGERYYRTGDLVRVLHDESMDFLGRADDQVKLRGQRLEMGEINHAIREGLPDKASDVTTVVTRRNNQNIDLLVSFIALSSDATSARELLMFYDEPHLELASRAREACRSRLSTYMVPSFIICVSRIPLSTNNKADINQLKKLFSDLSQRDLQTLASPSKTATRELTKLETKILEAFHLITRVQEMQICPSTTIYQLGIDSIIVPRLAKQLRTMGFVAATPSLILRNPRICQLSQALGSSDCDSAAPRNNSLQFSQWTKSLWHRYLGVCCTALDVKATGVEYIAPCTPLQQGIIARSKTREAQLAYFNQFKLRLAPKVLPDLLKAAFARVVSSYSILRTAFVDAPDGHLQVALKNPQLRWFEVEADKESFDKLVCERRYRWIEDNHYVLKSPVEVDHVVVSGQHYLLLRLFHAVYDARSLRIILESFESEFSGISLPTSPTFLSVLAEGPFLNHQASHPFWKAVLKDHRFQPMPSLIDTPGASDVIITRENTFPGLEDRRKSLEVTHQTLLQAAWLQTLHKYFVEPPTIGVILSGRSLAVDNVDRVVGPLFNTLPLRADFTETRSWAELTCKIQEQNNDLLAFVHTPLRDIQKLYTNGQPLFDTLFTFDQDYSAAKTNEKALWSIEDSDGHPDYPLAIEAILAEDNKLQITLAAQKSIANAGALNALLDQFIGAINSIISSPDDVLDLPSPQLSIQSVETTDPTPFAITESSIESLTTPNSTFEWSDRACKIRHELAALTKTDEEEITEAANLFALGLDSIDMIRFAGKLTKLGHDVSFSTLMKQPTLQAIISVLEKPQPTTTDLNSNSELDNMISILEDFHLRAGPRFPDVEAILPPTPLQDSMVAEMIHSRFRTYFNHDVLELPPNIHIGRLKSALATVYSASPIFRTVFVEVDDPQISSAYYQVVRNHELEIPSRLKIPDIDQMCTITDLARINALQNNGASNLFQVHFVECNNSKFMVLSIAHALYDGWSLQMLHGDIHAAYEGTFSPRQTYKPYLSRMLSLSDSSPQDFWVNSLNGADATLISQTLNTPAQDTIHRFEGRSKRSAAGIKNLCKQLRITPQVLGLGCWAAVLSSLTGRLEVVFGVVLSGRDTEQAQGLMFPTMNTVPLRLALHGSVSEFLAYLQEIMSRVVEYQHTPLREIQKLSGIQGKLFNTVFLLQDVRNDSPLSTRSSENIFKSVYSVSAVDYPLCAELELREDDVFWNIAGDSNYVAAEQVADIGTCLESVLDYLARDFNAQVLTFDAQRSSRVSVCGLVPVVFQTDVKSQEASGAALIESPELRVRENLPLSEEGREYDTLLDVLSELSRVDRKEIDLYLSIFHVGLDSISAIKASSMLRKRGYEITTRDLVTSSSIRSILERMRNTRPMGPDTQPRTEAKEVTAKALTLDSDCDGKNIATQIQRVGIDVYSVEALLPALPMQVHMLSVWQDTHGQTYFPRFSYRISFPVSRTDITRAWEILADEMPMLRTYFISTNTSSEPPFLQVIVNSAHARERAISISRESEGDSKWEFLHSATPFAIVRFLGGTERETEMHLRIHHSLYDGVSLPMLLNRFVELCGNPASPAQIATSSWYEFVMRHLSSPVHAQKEEFWKSYLSGDICSQLSLVRGEGVRQRERVNEFRSSKLDHIAKIKRRASAQGITMQALLLTAYAKVFARWARHSSDNPNTDTDRDCVFGIYLGNRSLPNLETTPFPTLAILPLRVNLPLSRDIVMTASQIQKDIAEISKFEHTTASLWGIQKWTGVRVRTCVNILPPSDPNSLPDAVLDSDAESSLGDANSGFEGGHENPADGKGQGVILEKILYHEGVDRDIGDMSTHIIHPESESLCPNAVRDSYGGIVDIEMALRDDVLNVGVFGFSDTLAGAQARDMIREIVDEVRTYF